MISTPLLSTFNSQPPQLISAAQLVDEMAASGSVSTFSTANVPAAASQAAATGSHAAASLASSSDPASQLVNELFESLKQKAAGNSPSAAAVSNSQERLTASSERLNDDLAANQNLQNFKANRKPLNPSAAACDSGQEQPDPASATLINFAANLKKTDKKPDKAIAQDASEKIDFKAHLRKTPKTTPSKVNKKKNDEDTCESPSVPHLSIKTSSHKSKSNEVLKVVEQGLRATSSSMPGFEASSSMPGSATTSRMPGSETFSSKLGSSEASSRTPGSSEASSRMPGSSE